MPGRIAIGFLAGLAIVLPAAAQSPSADEIARALQRPPGIRGLPWERGLGRLTEPQQPRRIDLYIGFKYNSAELEPDAIVTLRELGAALKSDALADERIEVIGHTDAKGDDDYNFVLSERRANAVRNLLVGMFDIAPDRLRASGRGKRELKDPARPEDGINRRVEVRNVSEP